MLGKMKCKCIKDINTFKKGKFYEYIYVLKADELCDCMVFTKNYTSPYPDYGVTYNIILFREYFKDAQYIRNQKIDDILNGND